MTFEVLILGKTKYPPNIGPPNVSPPQKKVLTNLYKPRAYIRDFTVYLHYLHSQLSQ